MSKVLVIGIDSLDADLISKFENDLPNFKRLSEQNSNISFQSVFPPIQKLHGQASIQVLTRENMELYIL